MKLKRILALLLCAVLLLAVAAGCNGSSDDPPPDDPVTSEEPPPEEPSATEDPDDKEAVQGIDFDAAFSAFSPDTVMVIAGEYSITWPELYYNIIGTLDNLVSSIGMFPDLSASIDGITTYADMVLEFSVENAMTYRAIEYGAKLADLTIGAEDLEMLRENYEELIAQYGGEEEFLKILWEYDGIGSKELFEYLFHTGFLATLLFEELYGAEGSLMTDEDMEAFTSFDGYMMAKHILRMKTEDGDETPLEESEAILSQLKSYSGDDFESFYDTLMHAHSEDTGLTMFPDGYLFQYGDMVMEFYDSCFDLEIGEFSGIVETEYGYHIIYRIPINFDTIPSSRMRVSDYRTLRYITASGLFDYDLRMWTNALELVYTAEYESIDLALLFTWH